MASSLPSMNPFTTEVMTLIEDGNKLSFSQAELIF